MGHKDVKGKFEQLSPKEKEQGLKELGLNYNSKPTGNDLQILEKKGFFSRIKESFKPKTKNNQDNFNLPSL